ncbi:MAG: hypothetical protein ACT443_01330 [Gemmatimonadota bacterium]
MMRFLMVSMGLASLCAGCGPAAAPRTSAPECEGARVLGRLPPELGEASGITVSRRNPGVFWVHNDDQPALLFAVDSTGRIRARVRVPGSTNRDWEDIAAARCGSDDCLYIADIGNNTQTRATRAIYRVIEPLLTDRSTTAPVRFSFRMPDKAHDAEAVIVLDDEMYVITKGRSGPVTVFAFPTPLRADTTVELKPIAQLTAGLVQLPDMVTGAAVVPGTRTVAVRTYSGFQFYRLDGVQVTPVYDQPYDLRPLDEPQGEGIAVRADGAIFLVSERSVEAAALIARVRCRLPEE